MPLPRLLFTPPVTKYWLFRPLAMSVEEEAGVDMSCIRDSKVFKVTPPVTVEGAFHQQFFTLHSHPPSGDSMRGVRACTRELRPQCESGCSLGWPTPCRWALPASCHGHHDENFERVGKHALGEDHRLGEHVVDGLGCREHGQPHPSVPPSTPLETITTTPTSAPAMGPRYGIKLNNPASKPSRAVRHPMTVRPSPTTVVTMLRLHRSSASTIRQT